MLANSETGEGRGAQQWNGKAGESRPSSETGKERERPIIPLQKAPENKDGENNQQWNGNGKEPELPTNSETGRRERYMPNSEAGLNPTVKRGQKGDKPATEGSVAQGRAESNTQQWNGNINPGRRGPLCATGPSLLEHREAYPPLYTVIHTPREARVRYTPLYTHPGRLGWGIYTLIHTQGG